MKQFKAIIVYSIVLIVVCIALFFTYTNIYINLAQFNYNERYLKAFVELMTEHGDYVAINVGLIVVYLANLIEAIGDKK